MEPYEQDRSVRKHQAIVKAATAVFLSKGYQGASMDEIAANAGVSKQTVYKHFADKNRLFTEIVMATTDRVDDIVHFVADAPGNADTLEEDLTELAQRLLTTLMQPSLVQLRRMIIASAGRFPELGRLWYERGFGRVLATLTTTFQNLSDKGLLRLDDALVAAQHFVGMLLWVPVNQAMFSPDDTITPEQLADHARSATLTFLAAYRPPVTATATASAG